MRQLDRRRLLQGIGLGTAGLLLPRRLSAAQIGLAAAEPLIDRIRKASPGETFDVLSAAIRAGADQHTLLAAAFAAGVIDIRPRSVGGKLHAVMMVESAYQLLDNATDQEAWLAAIWAVNDFKTSQERDRREGEWVLPPRPVAKPMSATKAKSELVSALEAWNADQADRALVALLPHSSRDQIFEILWPFAARCYVDLGHKIIFATQVERVLRRLSWSDTEPALRSLVNGLLYIPEGAEPHVASFNTACQHLGNFPENWSSGRESPDLSLTILRKLRVASPEEAQNLLVDAAKDGLGPATLWDGLRLYAAELFHCRPMSAARRHAPVHPVTEVNAFAYVFRTSTKESTRHLSILQAAGWLPQLRDDLDRFFGPPRNETLDKFDPTTDGRAPNLNEIFEAPSPKTAHHYLDSPKATGLYLDTLRHHLTHRAFQSHQYKFAAAIQEESALINPCWATKILAPAITYLPTSSDPETETYRRSMFALKKAGVTE